LIKGTEKVLHRMVHAAHWVLRKCVSQRSLH
jgi:hypothetical protein